MSEPAYHTGIPCQHTNIPPYFKFTNVGTFIPQRQRHCTLPHSPPLTTTHHAIRPLPSGMGGMPGGMGGMPGGMGGMPGGMGGMPGGMPGGMGGMGGMGGPPDDAHDIGDDGADLDDIPDLD